MKDLKEMTMRELVEYAKAGPHYLSWAVVREIERRLPVIEAAVESADSLISKQDAQAAYIDRTLGDSAFHRACHKSEASSDAYRAAKEANGIPSDRTPLKSCQQCELPFSEWFTWLGIRYCFPCWVRSGHRIVIDENGETTNV